MYSSRLSTFIKEYLRFPLNMAAQRNSDHYQNSPNISKQILNSTILNRSVGEKSDDN